ncbi:hypothetical protein CHS0354_029721 [Potamilus streckersoni]|uniref:Uncharacterized protein n=1 Tax=Potamilus streckersoni TaxID=2493646 RepID=A0AAE0RTI2_9BIVA|nr:hypothetical protein CHS0354_029721 [Potamilus streckersoni]
MNQYTLLTKSSQFPDPDDHSEEEETFFDAEEWGEICGCSVGRINHSSSKTILIERLKRNLQGIFSHHYLSPAQPGKFPNNHHAQIKILQSEVSGILKPFVVLRRKSGSDGIHSTCWPTSIYSCSDAESLIYQCVNSSLHGNHSDGKIFMKKVRVDMTSIQSISFGHILVDLHLGSNIVCGESDGQADSTVDDAKCDSTGTDLVYRKMRSDQQEELDVHRITDRHHKFLGKEQDAIGGDDMKNIACIFLQSKATSFNEGKNIPCEIISTDSRHILPLTQGENASHLNSESQEISKGYVELNGISDTIPIVDSGDPLQRSHRELAIVSDQSLGNNKYLELKAEAEAVHERLIVQADLASSLSSLSQADHFHKPLKVNYASPQQQQQTEFLSIESRVQHDEICDRSVIGTSFSTSSITQVHSVAQSENYPCISSAQQMKTIPQTQPALPSLSVAITSSHTPSVTTSAKQCDAYSQVNKSESLTAMAINTLSQGNFASLSSESENKVKISKKSQTVEVMLDSSVAGPSAPMLSLKDDRSKASSHEQSAGRSRKLEDSKRSHRQFHPYKKQEKKRKNPSCSFETTYRDLAELLQNLTSKTYKQSSKAPRVTNCWKKTTSQPSRFSNFRFCRSKVPLLLPRSGSPSCEDDTNSLTPDMIPNFDEWHRTAELLEELFASRNEETYNKEECTYQREQKSNKPMVIKDEYSFIQDQTDLLLPGSSRTLQSDMSVGDEYKTEVYSRGTDIALIDEDMNDNKDRTFPKEWTTQMQDNNDKKNTTFESRSPVKSPGLASEIVLDCFPNVMSLPMESEHGCLHQHAPKTELDSSVVKEGTPCISQCNNNADDKKSEELLFRQQISRNCLDNVNTCGYSEKLVMEDGDFVNYITVIVDGKQIQSAFSKKETHQTQMPLKYFQRNYEDIKSQGCLQQESKQIECQNSVSLEFTDNNPSISCIHEKRKEVMEGNGMQQHNQVMDPANIGSDSSRNVTAKSAQGTVHGNEIEPSNTAEKYNCKSHDSYASRTLTHRNVFSFFEKNFLKCEDESAIFNIFDFSPILVDSKQKSVDLETVTRKEVSASQLVRKDQEPKFDDTLQSSALENKLVCLAASAPSIKFDLNAARSLIAKHYVEDESSVGSQIVEDERSVGSQIVEDESFVGSKIVEDESSVGSQIVEDERSVGSQIVEDKSSVGSQRSVESQIVEDESSVESKIVEDESSVESKIVEDESSVGSQIVSRYSELRFPEVDAATDNDSASQCQISDQDEIYSHVKRQQVHCRFYSAIVSDSQIGYNKNVNSLETQSNQDHIRDEEQCKISVEEKDGNSHGSLEVAHIATLNAEHFDESVLSLKMMDVSSYTDREEIDRSSHGDIQCENTSLKQLNSFATMQNALSTTAEMQVHSTDPANVFKRTSHLTIKGYKDVESQGINDSANEEKKMLQTKMLSCRPSYRQHMNLVDETQNFAEQTVSSPVKDNFAFFSSAHPLQVKCFSCSQKSLESSVTNAEMSSSSLSAYNNITPWDSCYFSKNHDFCVIRSGSCKEDSNEAEICDCSQQNICFRVQGGDEVLKHSNRTLSNIVKESDTIQTDLSVDLDIDKVSCEHTSFSESHGVKSTCSDTGLEISGNHGSWIYDDSNIKPSVDNESETCFTTPVYLTDKPTQITARLVPSVNKIKEKSSSGQPEIIHHSDATVKEDKVAALNPKENSVFFNMDSTKEATIKDGSNSKLSLSAESCKKSCNWNVEHTTNANTGTSKLGPELDVDGKNKKLLKPRIDQYPDLKLIGSKKNEFPIKVSTARQNVQTATPSLLSKTIESARAKCFGENIILSTEIERRTTRDDKKLFRKSNKFKKEISSKIDLELKKFYDELKLLPNCGEQVVREEICDTQLPMENFSPYKSLVISLQELMKKPASKSMNGKSAENENNIHDTFFQYMIEESVHKNSADVANTQKMSIDLSHNGKNYIFMSSITPHEMISSNYSPEEEGNLEKANRVHECFRTKSNQNLLTLVEPVDNDLCQGDNDASNRIQESCDLTLTGTKLVTSCISSEKYNHGTSDVSCPYTCKSFNVIDETLVTKCSPVKDTLTCIMPEIHHSDPSLLAEKLKLQSSLLAPKIHNSSLHSIFSNYYWDDLEEDSPDNTVSPAEQGKGESISRDQTENIIMTSAKGNQAQKADNATSKSTHDHHNDQVITIQQDSIVEGSDKDPLTHEQETDKLAQADDNKMEKSKESASSKGHSDGAVYCTKIANAYSGQRPADSIGNVNGLFTQQCESCSTDNEDRIEPHSSQDTLSDEICTHTQRQKLQFLQSRDNDLDNGKLVTSGYNYSLTENLDIDNLLENVGNDMLAEDSDNGRLSQNLSSDRFPVDPDRERQSLDIQVSHVNKYSHHLPKFCLLGVTSLVRKQGSKIIKDSSSMTCVYL